MPKKLTELFLVVTILIGFVAVRFYRINTPLADWHSSRQADTAAVARNFVQEKFDLLYPQSDSLWALSERQLPNPNRYFMNEFPLYNATVALIYQNFGINHVYGRIVSVVISLIGAAYLYLLAKQLVGRKVGLAALLYYSFLPYNIYYSRVFMPDPTFAAFSIITLYYCVKYVETKKVTHGLLMGLTFAVATLVKPYAVFISIPMTYWLIRNRGWKVLLDYTIYLYALIAIVPLILWRYHLSLYPEGSFASAWLLNGGNIRFTGAFFRWLIFDRLNRLIFATGGFVLFITGFIAAHQKKNTSLFFVWAGAVFLYYTIFAKGNVNHDYYQLPIVAPGVVLAAIGAKALIDLGRTKIAKYINSLIVLALFLISIAFGWFEVRDYYNINNPAIVEAGKKIDEITPKDAIVIAPYFGDQAFLYQTNRSGWPVGGNIEERMHEGATHYVTTSRDQEYGELKAKYTLIFENNLFSIIELVPNGKTEK
jgi:4-amino-4-deoxy-L-arabinose transferase-like glycosyltransferase